MKNPKILLMVTTVVLSLSCATTTSQSNKKSSIEAAMVKALEWQEAHPIFATSPVDWTNGAYYSGVVRAHQATQNQAFIAALKTKGYMNDWKTDPRYHHADDLAISYAYLYVNTTREHLVNLESTDNFIQKHLFDDHKWKEGSDEKMEQILWWWCDALFMAPPVLANYSKYKGDEKYLDEMHKYYMETYNLLYDKKEHLFARDLRFVWTGKPTDKKAENGKKIFWSRGNGWVLGGLALVLEDMPINYKHRPFYENLFKEMALKLKDIQSKDGLWSTSLLSPESFNHGETSGSGFFTFAMAWGINNGLLSKEAFEPAVLKAWKALETTQKDNGMIGWVQNIGFDPRPADADSWQNYGTGAFLLAGSEILKLK